MPEVVFEIHGRKYPLPASTYTNEVRPSGGSLAHLAPLLSRPGQQAWG